jgi:acetyl-CoA carboxylase biotin carboxylase subunit
MIEKILIANRGEIALRIVRACKDLGIASVVAHSSADRDTMAVQLADEAVCIGEGPTQKSYLRADNIITAACLMRCDAIHPGIGFLSESADFARQVEEAGLIFIGPSSETIASLGNKVQARKIAKKAGLAVTPGSEEALIDVEDARRTAQVIGYPIILKASAGGGGRGMRIVRSEAALASAFALAQKEALLFFGDESLHLERFIQEPRHVEVQLLADGKGGVIHLGERDCSVQKNHQKLFEESPSPALDERTRSKMCTAATKLFAELGYRGAGTVEFLVEGKNFYFMEVNARLQVEHPVSEMISSIDLVRSQIEIAKGGRLPLTQREVRLFGYSLECRINAHGAGKITRFRMPSGPQVRVDTYLEAGSVISAHYDSLLAKVIVHTANRDEGLRVMARALEEVTIEGVETNLSEQRLILKSRNFACGRFSTKLYDEVINDEQ